MPDEVIQDYEKICEIFADMRKKMRVSQKYSDKATAINNFYEALRQFAYDIGLTPPFIPVEDDEDDWLTCRR